MSTNKGTRRNGLLESALKVASGTMHTVRRAVTPGLRGRAAHTTIISSATYSPWRVDRDFTEWHRRVAGSTLLDEMRLYELWQLAAQVADLEGDAIEIGCWRGGAGCTIAHRIGAGDPHASTFLCDTFEGVVKAGPRDDFYVGAEHDDTDESFVRTLIADLGLQHVEVLKGMFPDDTGDAVADRRFKFAHIDVDVYQGAKESFDWLLPRLVVGGIVVFDDYGFWSTDGVRAYVDELAGRPDVVVVRNLNGQAVVVKRR